MFTGGSMDGAAPFSEAAVARLAEERLDHRFKGLPPDAEGLTVGALAAERRPLFTGGFTTPVLTLSSAALDHNLALMERWSAERGLVFAPHAKTSMAPRLFTRQLAHGAWGLTAATPAQVRVHRAFGVRRILLANEVVDAAALRMLAAELDADPEFRLLTYVDSVRGVELMNTALRAAGATRPLDVLVELGVDGGRTGARTEAECAAVADAVAATDTLRLAGVAGYEGEIPEAGPDRVRAWLRRLTALAVEFDGAGRFAGVPEIVVSAGGSSWFDAVADVLGELPPLSAPVRKVLRAGAYVTHDDGFYRRKTPFNRHPDQGGLFPALRLWAQVVSRPEPGRAYLDAGKRDAPYDIDLPEPQVVRSARDGSVRSAEGMRVVALADQHTFVELAEGAELEVGDWVGLGLSHPCTAFDKWRLIPLVEEDGTVTDYVRTFF
ncbi:amino acid deaminase [Streptomyces albireticuli]|nr:amino acid deaminase [Streptomyces albireticuli]MCD9142682.1 amino acid deaminase [Streptomyces albireticuli]MCD9162999.1 amino acid deaminase [Streptomyces albireticuli]MCD9192810.1 amino acid deaminase [Streptomyces albireticuli]